VETSHTASLHAFSHWRDYLELTKPRIIALIVLTSIVGTLLATPGLPPLDALILGNLGIGLASASAAAINHVLDRRIDAHMTRTRRRPLPTGQLSHGRACCGSTCSRPH
jgi:protoheme IX farnesyltransferase